MKIRHKFLWSLSSLFLGFALMLVFVSVRAAGSAVGDLGRARIRAEVDLLAFAAGAAGSTDLQQLAVESGRLLDLRVTVIDADGTVLADSTLDRAGIARTENHAGRPELEQARSQGVGEDVRRSATTGVEYHYFAKRVETPDGHRYVRLAAPLTGLGELPPGFVLPILAGFLGAFLLLSAVAYVLIRGPYRTLERMQEAASRMADGDMAETLPYSGADELGRLAAAINRMKRNLAERIDELHKERRRASSVISQMREGLLVVGSDRRVLFGNPTFARIFRLDFDPQGHQLAEIIRAPTVIRDLDTVLHEGIEIRESVFRAPESGRSFELHVTPLREGENDGIQGALILFFDITRLEALENVRRDFVANVSHELRTPLTSIKAFVETLVTEGLEDHESSLKFLGIVRKHTARMEELIDDLTDLSLIETGAIELEVREVDACKLAGEVASQIAHRHPEMPVQVAVALPAPFLMRADRRRLEQILLNLVDNAVKFSRPGGEVRIAGETEGDTIRLRVEDDGIGIPTDSLEKVFHRFYRVDRARSREVGGTGLGLAIVKHLMRLHGGTVRVQSEIGKGSTFLLDFPALPETPR